MNKKILVIGTSNIDFIFRVPHFHQVGETIVAEVMTTAFGGKGANQAITIKQLGSKVIFLTKLGNDVYGEQYKKYFLKKGMDAKWILKDKKLPTGMAIIELSPKGENRIMVSPGANHSLLPKDLIKNPPPWKEINLFLTQLEIPLETVSTGLELAQTYGVITILNPSPGQRLSSRILSMVDFLIPNETEAEIISGIKIRKDKDIEKIGNILMEMGSRNIVVTLGEKGLFFKNQDETIWMEAFKVDVKDTTAAGDAFIGAFAHGIHKGWPIREVLKFANASGALATTKIGAQPSLPMKKDLDDFFLNNLKY